jgi:hypothetical protein
MIPFFNIPDIFKFPQNIRNSYEVRREYSSDNRDYRNTLLALPQDLAALDISMNNLNQIEGRIESRISKDEAAGIDTATTSALFDIAQKSLADATIAVAEAESTTKGVEIHPVYMKARFALDGAKDALETVVNNIQATEASSTLE